METPNVYLTIIIIGIIILLTKVVYIKYPKKEKFGNPVSILQKIGKAFVDFSLNLIDILLVIADVFSWIALLPFIIMDLIMIAFTWLWPITMIKGVVTSIFLITKILLLAVIDLVAHILRMFFQYIFSFLKGGLWGLPHGPEQHHKHIDISSGYADSFGDHHHGPHGWPDHTGGGRNTDKDMYRPLRCYKSVGSEGFINMAATIICPPLGVFMAFGLKGWIKIALCCILSLAYYVPGLVYALLITTHLGLGRKITAKDCGGIANYGIRLAGCTGINNKIDCESATIPGWRTRSGDTIRACGFKSDPNQAEGGKCYNIIYPSAVHTFGNRDRLSREVGNGAYHKDDDSTIDDSRELAYDVDKDNDYIPDNEKNPKINYNPLFLAKEVDKGNLDEEDQIEIPSGPWRYVGGD